MSTETMAYQSSPEEIIQSLLKGLADTARERDELKAKVEQLDAQNNELRHALAMQWPYSGA